MTNMDALPSPDSPGAFEARYLAFLETITHLRPTCIFCAIRRRCQASSVSGVTIVANSTNTFRPSPFALAANRRRGSSVKRSRLLPSCSRRTRFSSRR
jgi:hypothetical protein